MDTLTGWGMGEAEGWQDPYMDAHAGFLGFRWIQWVGGALLLVPIPPVLAVPGLHVLPQGPSWRVSADPNPSCCLPSPSHNWLMLCTSLLPALS